MRSASDQLRAALTADAMQLAAGRAVAAQMDADEPYWHIWYGPGIRALFAFPLWDPGCALLVSDPHPRALRAAMRAAERGDRASRLTDPALPPATSAPTVTSWPAGGGSATTPSTHDERRGG